jgi:hypothetical protein
MIAENLQVLSCGTTFVPSFVYIGQLLRKLSWWTQKHQYMQYMHNFSFLAVKQANMPIIKSRLVKCVISGFRRDVD